MLFRKGVLSSSVFFVCLRVIAASSGDARQGPTELALTLIQASARVQVRPAHSPNLEAPRMYVCEGCDGSTATLAHACEILNRHGFDVGVPNIDREYLMHAKSIGYFNKRYRDKNQTFVFKSIMHRDKSKTIAQSLKNLGTMAVYVTRKNTLDHLVCMIRDCFWKNEKYGHTVSADGTELKSKHCFRGRGGSEGKGSKAHLQVIEPLPNPNPEHPPYNRSHLQENLLHVEELVDEGHRWLKEAGYTGPRIWYEDICAFEKGGAGNLATSSKLWVELLKAWGVTADMKVLNDYLKSKAGTWKQQRQQAEIHNYKEVVAELKALGKEHLIRD